MFEGNGNPRRLPFPLQNQISNGNIIDNAGLPINEFVWPSDPTERTILPLYLSQQEFTAILSSMDVGADIAYPLQYIAVMWLMRRNLVYGPNICDMVTDCIENNPATRQAIIDMIMANQELADYFGGIAQEQGLSNEQRNENILKPNTCDYGFVFNQATVAVDILNDLSWDIIQAVEGLTNSLERAEFLSGLFGTGKIGLAVNFLTGLAEQIVEEISEDYVASYTETLEDELRCGLFCLAKDTCVLTIEQIYNYYSQKLAVIIPSDPEQSLKFLLEYAATATVPGDATVYLMHMLVISGFRAAQNLLGIDFTTFALRIIAAGDESNNDWEILCEECVDNPTVLLVAAPGWNEETCEFISSDGEFDTYHIHATSTGHLASGAFVSVGGVTFYIHSMDKILGETEAYFQIGEPPGSFNRETMPCNVGTDYIGMYSGYGTVYEIVISRNPCIEQTVWLKLRTDGDWNGRPFSWIIVGQTPTGGMIFDVLDENTTGPVTVGFDTVNEEETELVGTYLVSATVGGVEVYYHYHEQAESIGEGDGASGTVSHKKYSFILLGGHGQTVRVTLEPNPY